MKNCLVFCAAFCALQGVAMDKIIVSSFTQIKSLNIDGSNETVIATGFLIGGLKFEPFTQQVYWSELNVASDISTIWRANPDGSQATPVLTNQPGWVRDFAFDPLSQVFWFSSMSYEDATVGGIWRANFDGTGLSMIYGVSCVGLDYDLETGKLYASLDGPCDLCHWGEALYVMNPDGSQAEELYRGQFEWFLQIKINPVDRKLYCSLAGIDSWYIERIDLDGTNIENPPYFETRGFDIDPQNQWIYGGRYDYQTFSYTLVRFATDGTQYQELTPPTKEAMVFVEFAPERPFMAIPTLTGIGMGTLILALMAAAVWTLRRNRIQRLGG